MKNFFFSTFTIIALLASCVSQSEHDKIISEKDAISEQRDKLQQELEDIKFGAPNLLSDGKKFYEAKDFIKARDKFQILVNKHPDMPQSIEAGKYLSNIDEEELWSNASVSEDIGLSKSYISKYPRGKYISKATSRKQELDALYMERAYNDALIGNTSSSWKRFLKDYPDHIESLAIEEKIIRLEVDEIMGDSETGKMPSFNQYGSSYSSNSVVRITNDTGCELTVRYSGPDVEKIIIPKGSTMSVNLTSGNYNVAASACGANYAGSESLHGEYGSTFYIRTTHY